VRTLGWSGPELIWWESQQCVEHYNLYRLTADRLVDADENGLADDYGACFAPGLPLPEAFDPEEPPAGLAHFYLATGTSALGEGSLGTSSAGMERPNLAPCP
jgi:hypothetical protein